MQELEVDLEAFGDLFATVQSSPFTLVEIHAEQAAALAGQLEYERRQLALAA